jgi:hypothetical protein
MAQRHCFGTGATSVIAFCTETFGESKGHLSKRAHRCGGGDALGASGQIDYLTPFIGVIKGAPPSLSESVDDIYR